jgi:molecular chaperone DnaK
MATNNEQKIAITASTNLTEAEIQNAVKEAEAHAAEDKKRKESVENKNKLDGLIFQIEKTMKDSGDKLSDEDKTTVENAVKEAKAELESNDNDRIVKATEKLSNDVQAVFTKLYQQAQQAGGEAGAPNDGDTEFHQ